MSFLHDGCVKSAAGLHRAPARPGVGSGRLSRMLKMIQVGDSWVTIKLVCTHLQAPL